MLTSEENKLLTPIGPGAPMGQFLRQFWLPFLLSEELPAPDCAPLPVRLLGEDLVAFRDSGGRLGLLDAHCPHRLADLFYGRNEECGLRCVYHGWKFDVEGHCVDMPTETPESTFKDRVTVTAYPLEEAGGAIWAYMGPAPVPIAAPRCTSGATRSAACAASTTAGSSTPTAAAWTCPPSRRRAPSRSAFASAPIPARSWGE